MKSSIKISIASLGLVCSVLVSAAAASAADKIAVVDEIVNYSQQDITIMAGQNEFFEQIETESYEENEIQNDFEIVGTQDDKELRPTDTPQSRPTSSSSVSMPSKNPSASLSSSKPSSSKPSSSKPSSSKPASSSSKEHSSSKDEDVSSAIASNENTSSESVKKGEYLKFKGNGVLYNLPVKEALKHIVSNELDGNFDMEAIKAQVVATHTYVKYYNDRNQIASVGYKSYKKGGKIDKAVEEVYNLVMTYNGKTIFSPYFASAAGRTNSSREVWGGTLAYLVSVESKYDYLADYYNLSAGTYSKNKLHSRYLATKTVSEDVVKQKIEALGGSCSGKPKTWFKFISEENGGLTTGGYVGKIKLGGVVTTGKQVRSMFGLRSAKFEVSYKNGNFTFTTEGYGHGAGMSQWGAHFYADKENWSYKKILKHYYTGISLTKVS